MSMIAAYLGLSGQLYERPHDGTHPVLVLDPDNPEDMAAFGKAYHQSLKFPFDPTEALTEAVRTFLPKPTPPDPGMAVRVTAGGGQWARSTSGWWWRLGGATTDCYRWPDLCAKYPDLAVEDGDESVTQVAALVAEREAAAWDEGEQAGRDNADDGYPDPMVENPYRERAQ